MLAYGLEFAKYFLFEVDSAMWVLALNIFAHLSVDSVVFISQYQITIILVDSMSFAKIFNAVLNKENSNGICFHEKMRVEILQ
jgi:hypothetical protein